MSGKVVWDVVVVGAGPAGAMAAYSAASTGSSVLLLEREVVPRYKTCGGGLIGSCGDLLPDEVVLPLQARIRAVTLTLPDGREVTRRSSRPLFDLVFRDAFDAALVKAARAAGAVVRTGVAVSALVDRGDGVVTLSTRGGGDLHGRAVVGCDGSAGRTGRFVGVVCDQVDLGLESEISASSALSSRWEGRVHIDSGPIPGSYGWLFPKTGAGVLSVGVIGARTHGDQLRRYWAEYTDRLGLARLPVLRSGGHLTRCRAPGSPLARGRVLVAGDAGGLLEPWTREGISYALASGRLAGGRAVRMAACGSDDEVASHGHAYYDEIESRFARELALGRRMQALFTRRPEILQQRMATQDSAWTVFTETSRGVGLFSALS